MVAWEAEALAYIKEISGSAPVHGLFVSFCRMAGKEKWHPRTFQAFKRKMERLGIPQQATDDRWNLSALARILGITQYRVKYWTKKGLSHDRRKGSHPEIRSTEVRKFAKNHPNLFRGIERDRLLFVLDDPKLCDRICALGKPSHGYATKVIRSDTLEVYPSIRAAAKAIGISHRAIWESVHYGKPTHGIQFKALGKRPPKDINAA